MPHILIVLAMFLFGILWMLRGVYVMERKEMKDKKCEPFLMQGRNKR